MIVDTICKNTEANNESYTPPEATYPILQYLKPQSVIWCPYRKGVR